MRILGPATAAVLAIAAPASAQPGQTLWKNINAGMPYSDVQALYPAVKGRVHHDRNSITIEGLASIGKCHPDVVVNFAKGVVRSVVLSARLRGFPATSCGEEAQTALVGKYGPPALAERGQQMILSRPATLTWSKDEVTIRFERPDPDGQDLWTIIYEPQSSVDV